MNSKYRNSKQLTPTDFSSNTQKVAQSRRSATPTPLDCQSKEFDVSTLSEALSAYSICAKAEGKSPKTIRHVVQTVGYFRDFMGGDIDLNSISANDLRRFIIGLQGKNKYLRHPFSKPQQCGLSPFSIATYCRGIKSFYAYLLREELIDQNPVQKVKVPRVPSKAVPTFSELQIEKLLSQPDKKSDIGFRDFAILLTFVDTSIRLWW